LNTTIRHVKFLGVLGTFAIFPLPLEGQDLEVKTITAAVSYVTVSSVYLDAGRDRGLAVGDTLSVSHGLIPRGTVVVTAVSSGSSAAQIVVQNAQIVIGDSASIVKRVPIIVQTRPAATQAEIHQLFPRSPAANDANIVTGRFALQYAAAAPVSGPTTFSQPSALLRLDIARLFGSGLTFSMYGRSSYDLSDEFARYAEGSRFKVRMYEFSLAFEDVRSWFAYSVGRLTSRYVGGLGQFDGGQFYLRRGNVSAGVLLGLQPDYLTSGVNTEYQKMAAFVNYAWGGSVFALNDITIAYGQQLYHGRLDRDFVYIQSSIRLGSRFSLYQSTEIDLHKPVDTVRTGAFRVANTFVSLSYYPVDWLSTSAGYDASRNIYLFESMRSIPVALLDRTLQQGLRGSITARLPLNIALMGSANVRVKKGEDHTARTLGTGIRVSDIAKTDLNAGFQYLNIRGLYTEGSDIIVDLERWMSPSFSVSLRVDRYSYTLLSNATREVNTTASANVNARISQSLYALLSVDHVWDPLTRNLRFYSEIGVRF